jgi:hypothetical protein
MVVAVTDDDDDAHRHLSHLSNVTDPYDPSSRETPYFWDVHFSGESVAEHAFAVCHGLVQACEFGLRQRDYNEDVSLFIPPPPRR